MAVAFVELNSGLRIERDTRERVYLATGSTNENEVETEAYEYFPPTEGGIGPLRVRVEPIDAERGLWEVTTTYNRSGSSSAPLVGAESSFEFEIGTTSTHITQSRRTVAGHSIDDEEAVPDFDQAIGVTQDGVDGCDILTPESRFSETHYLSAEFVTPAYRRMLRSMVGKVNLAPFRDHDGGEVLLVGIRGGRRRSDDVWELTFAFATSENAFKIAIGDIVVPRKAGWDYLWVYYEPQVVSDRLVSVPKFAFVEEVYQRADFFDLGIGE